MKQTLAKAELLQFVLVEKINTIEAIIFLTTCMMGNGSVVIDIALLLN